MDTFKIVDIVVIIVLTVTNIMDTIVLKKLERENDELREDLLIANLKLQEKERKE